MVRVGSEICFFFSERPIRHFERLSDVQASWNKDKLVNTFVLRLTSLAPLLSRSVSVFAHKSLESGTDPHSSFRPFRPARPHMLGMSSGKVNAANGANAGYNYANTPSGYPNVTT